MTNTPDVQYVLSVIESLLNNKNVIINRTKFFVKWEGNIPILYEFIKNSHRGMVAYKKTLSFTSLYELILKAESVVIED